MSFRKAQKPRNVAILISINLRIGLRYAIESTAIYTANKGARKNQWMHTTTCIFRFRLILLICVSSEFIISVRHDIVKGLPLSHALQRSTPPHQLNSTSRLAYSRARLDHAVAISASKRS
jgi:hypothetical protein